MAQHQSIQIPSFKGELLNDAPTLDKYSHDASLFEIRPQLVAFPKNAEDISTLVKYVKAHKRNNPDLSLTARSGGTDMSGGAINDSIIVTLERYFKKIGPVSKTGATVEPGVYYRDFEPKTLSKGLLFPSYPASREICMMGGIINNNSGGEKSLVYGKTERYVKQLKVILSDGEEHTIKPLSNEKLQKKLAEDSFEGRIHKKVLRLLEKNQDVIARSKPVVSKNSTGYNIWDAWDGKTLDLTKLLVGAQGTLGITTQATLRLVAAKPLSGMMVVLMPSLKNLGNIINALLPLQATSIESFDEHTLKFALRFFYSFRTTLGWKRFIMLGLSFIPVLNKMLRFLPHFPKMILLVEFEGKRQSEIDAKIDAVEHALRKFDVTMERARDKHHEEKFWVMRRESFNLLRKNIKRKHAAPFIDDLIVPPPNLPEFLPKLYQILDRHKLLYTIAGHMGDGNFHIIPLMDLTKLRERNKISAVLQEVTDLVVKYKGSLSGEHNDGLVRGPFLDQMYPSKVIEIFSQIKTIFDPQNIFNPHKKITSDWSYSEQHIRKKF
ncbi:FAD-binding oxidoreductase [bacterium]|nr:MAG: FAD-binding oxidoreductase [bacterium]